MQKCVGWFILVVACGILSYIVFEFGVDGGNSGVSYSHWMKNPLTLFLTGVSIAFLLTFSWKIFGGLRKSITGKEDVISDEVKSFNYRNELLIGSCLFLFFGLISYAARFSGDTPTAPFFFYGFFFYFPFLLQKRKIMGKMKKRIEDTTARRERLS